LRRSRRDRKGGGADEVLDALGLQQSPIIKTSAACQSGMAFMELRCVTANFGMTESVKEDAILFALQLQACPDFDLFADGRHFRAQGYRPGLLAMFDLNAGLCTDLQDPFHAVDFFLPRTAINAVTDDAGAPRMGAFPFPPGAVAEDEVSKHLMMALLPMLSIPAEHSSHLFVDHVAMAMAAHIVKTYGGVEMKDPRIRGGLAPWQERRVKELLNANLNGKLSLAELAMACDLSIRHFTRAFKTSTGLTAHDWLTLRRIEKAKGLLAQSPLPLTDIAFECGFADTSHFGRSFLRLVGTSPGEWRRVNRR